MTNDWFKEVSGKDIFRFFTKVKIGNEKECWEWTAKSNINEYGIFSVGGQDGWRVLAHRFSYFIYNNIEPSDLLVCHTCDNHKCVNPNHLFIGTQADNINDMLVKIRQCRKKPNSTSKFYGVKFYTRDKAPKWMASFTYRRKKTHIGMFQTEMEAAKAYDKYIIDNKIPILINFPEIKNPQ